MNATYLWTPYPAVHCIGHMHVLVALEISCLVPSFLINTVLFYVLITNSENHHSSQNIFSKSMTAADLLISGICQPLFVVSVLHIKSTDSIIIANIHRYTFILTSIACAASVSSLTLSCVQRYIQIVYPFKYESIFTPCRLWVALINIWLGGITSTSMLLVKGLDPVIFYLFVLSIILAILLAFVFIYLHTIRIIGRLILPSGEGFTPNSWRKATKTNAISITVFAALWLPFTILGVLFHLQNKTRTWIPSTELYACNSRTTTQATLFLYSIFLAHFHSLLNPVIHTLRNSYIKAAVVSLIRRVSSRVRQTDGISKNHTLRQTVRESNTRKAHKISNTTTPFECRHPIDGGSPFKLCPILTPFGHLKENKKRNNENFFKASVSQAWEKRSDVEKR